MVLKKKEDLSTTEEMNLLQKILESINPFLTDHSSFDLDE